MEGIPINVFIQAHQSHLSTSDDYPFCLTNVINKPILFYQLEFFERNLFKEVTIITPSKFSFQINTALQKYIGNIKTHVVTTKDESSFEDLNIFEVIHKKVTRSNFILLKGDTLLDFDIGNLVNFHLLNENFVSIPLVKIDFVAQEARPKISPYGKKERKLT